MKKTNKKGFTIVELVIVIAVIAILSAVLIPTFSGIVNKAKLSADQKAVREMNTKIATYDEGLNIADIKLLLANDNIDANNYKPLTKDAEFFWDGEQIVMVVNNEVVFPKNAEGAANKDAWQSLSGEGNKAVAELLAKNGTLSGVTNMQGASVNVKPANNYVLGSTDASAPATIKNVVSDEGSKVNATGAHKENTYYAGMISTVAKNTTVYVKNLVIDGAIVGDTTQAIANSARAGIVAGQVNGTLYIENVTIKNSTIFAGYRVGALVGAVSETGKVYINNVTFENVTVKAATIAAKLIGEVKAKSVVSIGTINGADTIKMVDINNAPASSINADGLITYDSDIYTIVTCAHLTQKYFWVQTGLTKLNGKNYNDGYVSHDVAYDTSYNVA